MAMASDFPREEELAQEEESGWTSYLLRCPNSSLLSDTSFSPRCTYDPASPAYNSLLLLGNLQLPQDSPPPQKAGYGDGELDEDDGEQAAGGANSIDGFPDDESCGSSTLSDADSLLCLHPRQANPPARSECRQEAPRNASSASASLDQIPAYYGEGDVSDRFHALEALIPCLKEVDCQENEEAMLNAIINHVQDLEQKVQLLSDVWRLSQINRG